MHIKKSPARLRLLIAIGLLFTTVPTVLKDIPVTMPDFFRGLLVGVGLGLEIIGFVLLKKNGGLVHKPKGRNAGL